MTVSDASIRVRNPELLDDGKLCDKEVRRGLSDLRRMNEIFGATRLLLKTLAQEASRHNLKRFDVLDIAAGSCDLPLAILDWAGQNGLDVEVFALDLWHRHLAMFKEDFK